MISKTFNRYIWLLNILLQKKKLTFEEISSMWVESNMGDGKPMSVRTFHQHRKAIEELFGLEIKCNVYDNYRYYLDSPEKLRNDRTRRWLFNSFSLSNLIAAGHNMNGRILFENIPHGTEYLQPVVEAMQRNKVLEIDYQPFGGHLATYHVEPYAMKVYHQRWYVVGKLKEKDEIRQISLDRINDLQLTDKSFTVPRSFNAERYYANTVGIFVNEELKPQKIRIRVYGNQVEYLRSLPLHKSQEEILTRYNEFSDFQLKVCLTPELSTQLLAMGEMVEVLEPKSLRDEMKKRLLAALKQYEE